MKTKLTWIYGLVAALGLAAAGCSKQESTAPQATEAQKAATTAADQAKKAADTVATEAKEAAGKLAEDAVKQVQPLIDRAKGLIADKKYQDALTVLQQLKGLKLTPEQQKLVDDLVAQAKKYVSGEAGKAVDSLMGGKK